MIERLGRRMTEFVGTSGAKVLRAVEEVVPGIEPPSHRRVTPARVVIGIATAGAAGATAALRHVLGGAGPSDGARAGGADAAALADRTRAELYELAQKADIEGRSAMSKDELVEALKKATPT